MGFFKDMISFMKEISYTSNIVGNKAKLYASVGKKSSVFGKLGVLCFLVTAVLEFALLSYLKAISFTKKKLQHRCFTVNIAKFLTTPTLTNTCKRLLMTFFVCTVCSLHFFSFISSKNFLKYFLKCWAVNCLKFKHPF